MGTSFSESTPSEPKKAAKLSQAISLSCGKLWTEPWKGWNSPVLMSLLGPQFAVEINERMWNQETAGQPRAWGTGNRRHGKARVKQVTYLRHKNKASDSKRERRLNMTISPKQRDKIIQLGTVSDGPEGCSWGVEDFPTSWDILIKLNIHSPQKSPGKGGDRVPAGHLLLPNEASSPVIGLHLPELSASRWGVELWSWPLWKCQVTSGFHSLTLWSLVQRGQTTP